jgi:hypothetical protein
MYLFSDSPGVSYSLDFYNYVQYPSFMRALGMVNTIGSAEAVTLPLSHR